MQKELYFDISSEKRGGSLYRMTENDGSAHYLYQFSDYNDDTGELAVQEKTFQDFASFWIYLTADPEWFYQHPLFVHPEQRPWVSGQLAGVNWDIHPNAKWQESHRRQWKKVLEAGPGYYRKDQ
jgi:hypothetical protein